jgi:hypothetical protein
MTRNLSVRRATILQRTLNFLDIPILETQVWETLENEQRKVVIEVLARLLAQAMMPDPNEEKGNEQ